jgi:hypothetical protein
MDDVVAVEVELDDGGKRYFLTWGRIQAAVDSPVSALVLRHAQHFSLGGEVVRARLCLWLHEAAESDSAPYFYEAYLSFAQERTPLGGGYEDWRQERARAMESGKEIYYCGNPNQVPPGRSYPWVTVD